MIDSNSLFLNILGFFFTDFLYLYIIICHLLCIAFPQLSWTKGNHIVLVLYLYIHWHKELRILHNYHPYTSMIYFSWSNETHSDRQLWLFAMVYICSGGKIVGEIFENVCTNTLFTLFGNENKFVFRWDFKILVCIVIICSSDWLSVEPSTLV